MIEDRLIRRLEERKEYRDRTEHERSFWNTEDMSQDLIFSDFWCRECGKDREFPARKVRMTWDGKEYLFYRALRSCHPLRRSITNKQLDPYYRRSRLVRKQAAKMSRDLLQPGDEGYRLAWG